MKTRISPTTVQAALHALQAAAIVIGGCWVVYRYFSQERFLATLNRRQLEITIADQRQQQRLSAEQLRLTNEQLGLAVADQKEQQRLAAEQLRLANQQARLTLTIGSEQQGLRLRELERLVALHDEDVQLRRAEREKVQHEVSYSGRYRFERQFSLTSRKRRDLGNGMGEYEVVFSFAFTNKSEVPFEVSVYALDYYLGTPRDISNVAGPTFRRISIPNLRSTSYPRLDDALQWKYMGSLGGMYGDSTHEPFWTANPPVTLVQNAMGTGVIKSDQTTSYTNTYFVTAPANAYVTFFLSYCFNGCRQDTDDFTHANVIPLEEDPTGLSRVTSRGDSTTTPP
ncbi:MAG TPA: hypothetical protein VJT67_13845 [Longimicrobiaceae bacterium]|nr:hypothetical protein [Longimicrobiaceae bacterium]